MKAAIAIAVVKMLGIAIALGHTRFAYTTAPH
jgi:hypothetical protein